MAVRYFTLTLGGKPNSVLRFDEDTKAAEVLKTVHRSWVPIHPEGYRLLIHGRDDNLGWEPVDRDGVEEFLERLGIHPAILRMPFN